MQTRINLSMLCMPTYSSKHILYIISSHRRTLFLIILYIYIYLSNNSDKLHLNLDFTWHNYFILTQSRQYKKTWLHNNTYWPYSNVPRYLYVLAHAPHIHKQDNHPNHYVYSLPPHNLINMDCERAHHN
jgi:hypothetical protein